MWEGLSVFLHEEDLKCAKNKATKAKAPTPTNKSQVFSNEKKGPSVAADVNTKSPTSAEEHRYNPNCAANGIEGCAGRCWDKGGCKGTCHAKCLACVGGCEGQLRKGYKLGPSICEGRHGLVRVGEKDGRKYALKMIPLEHYEENEFKLQRLVSDHPNVVQVFEVFRLDHLFVVVQELVEGGDLFELVQKGRKRNPRRMPQEDEMREVFAQMLAPVCELHKRRIAHQDIKLENYMLTSEVLSKTVVKLCDFGAAEELPSDGLSCCRQGHISPEKGIFIRTKKPYNGFKSDIFQLGLALHDLMFRIREPRKDGSINPYPGQKVSPELTHLLTGMLQILPENRFTLEQICSHPWLVDQKIDSLTSPVSSSTCSSSLSSPLSPSPPSSSPLLPLPPPLPALPVQSTATIPAETKDVPGPAIPTMTPFVSPPPTLTTKITDVKENMQKASALLDSLLLGSSLLPVSKSFSVPLPLPSPPSSALTGDHFKENMLTTQVPPPQKPKEQPPQPTAPPPTLPIPFVPLSNAPSTTGSGFCSACSTPRGCGITPTFSISTPCSAFATPVHAPATPTAPMDLHFSLLASTLQAPPIPPPAAAPSISLPRSSSFCSASAPPVTPLGSSAASPSFASALSSSLSSSSGCNPIGPLSLDMGVADGQRVKSLSSISASDGGNASKAPPPTATTPAPVKNQSLSASQVLAGYTHQPILASSALQSAFSPMGPINPVGAFSVQSFQAPAPRSALKTYNGNVPSMNGPAMVMPSCGGYSGGFSAPQPIRSYPPSGPSVPNCAFVTPHPQQQYVGPVCRTPSPYNLAPPSSFGLGATPFPRNQGVPVLWA